MSVLDQFHLNNRVAIVTGGRRGLGRAMALALAEAGAQVAVVSREAEQAQAAAQEIQTQTGQRCEGYGCDVSDKPDEIQKLVESIQNDFSQIDIVVNNAGINQQNPIEELPPADFRNILDTNLVGPWLLCRALVPHFKERHFGRIINISSTAAVFAYPGLTPYASSKAGLLQMTRALAVELGPHGITANCLLPGPFATEMNNLDRLKETNPQAYQGFLNAVPLRRYALPEEIGGLVVYLASEASSIMTGWAIARQESSIKLKEIEGLKATLA